MTVNYTFADKVQAFTGFSAENLRSAYRSTLEDRKQKAALGLPVDKHDEALRVFVEAGKIVAAREAAEAAPAAPAPVATPATAPARGGASLEIGMYKMASGSLVRVYPARNGGHLLAKRLVEQADGTWSFEYLGAARRFVQPSQRLSLEEAQAFGHQFGVCCVCGRLLTDPDSVAAGIGPICAAKF